MSQTDLDALDRMVAEAEAAPILWTSRAAFIWNAYPALAAELREARKRVLELEAEIEVRDNSANLVLDTLKAALPNRGFHSEMEAAEAAKEELAELRAVVKSPQYREMLAIVAGIDARDRRMKALGAAEWIRKEAREGGVYTRHTDGMMYDAAELEAAAGEGEGSD